jgi:DNA-binding NarL/FixJ family response regulator
MVEKTRVLVVDDHPFFRSGVVQWLNNQTDMICCGEADSVPSVRIAVANLHPDVLLLDLHLGDNDGLAFCEELVGSHPSMRVLVLSHRDEAIFAHRALRAGARGYVMKSQAAEVVATAIRTVMGGDIYVSRTVAARALHRLFPDPTSKTPGLDHLTDRELQVFQLIGARCSIQDIAAALRISSKTVGTYRDHLKLKLQLQSADELHRAAIRWVETGHAPPRADELGPAEIDLPNR